MSKEIFHFLTRGETVKEEKVKSIIRNVFPDTFVLENYEPFPGYFGANIPADIKPMSIFVVLSKRYDHLHLARIMKKISTEEKFHCDGTTATIDTGRTHYYSIRIKNLECFAHLYIMQEKFIEHGIELHKSKVIDKTVLISVQKTFFLEKMRNNIYKNTHEEYKYYFPLSNYLTWEQFKTLTIIVKNNIPNNLFDAALGYFYTEEGFTDMVRIYDKNGSVARITEIKEHYEKALNRI